jgi:hypothetical protein
LVKRQIKHGGIVQECIECVVSDSLADRQVNMVSEKKVRMYRGEEEKAMIAPQTENS